MDTIPSPPGPNSRPAHPQSLPASSLSGTFLMHDSRGSASLGLSGALQALTAVEALFPPLMVGEAEHARIRHILAEVARRLSKVAHGGGVPGTQAVAAFDDPVASTPPLDSPQALLDPGTDARAVDLPASVIRCVMPVSWAVGPAGLLTDHGAVYPIGHAVRASLLGGHGLISSRERLRS